MKMLISLILWGSIISCSQQQKLQKAEAPAIALLIEKKEFTFRVRTVLPTGGRAIQVNSLYDLQVTTDTIMAYIPYFGRAFTAPVGATDGGIQFTSTNFDFTTEIRKKGGWLITIKPRENHDIQQMFLTVSENGSAILQVTDNKRQPISYNGFIIENS